VRIEEPVNTVKLYLSAGPESIPAWYERGWPLLGQELHEWFTSAAARARLAPQLPHGAGLELYRDDYEASQVLRNEDLSADRWRGFLDGVAQCASAIVGSDELIATSDGTIRGGNANEVARGLTLDHTRHDNGLVGLIAWARADFLLDGERQQRTLEFFWELADAADPSYGEIAHSVLPNEYTALEYTMGAAGAHVRQQCIEGARLALRGYGWITIVPKELVAAIEQAPSFAGGDAFFLMRRMRSGALWLQATPSFTDYNPSVARKVAQALSPVLPPGQPHPALARQVGV
jgi:hypothetical protein